MCYDIMIHSGKMLNEMFASDSMIANLTKLQCALHKVIANYYFVSLYNYFLTTTINM